MNIIKRFLGRLYLLVINVRNFLYNNKILPIYKSKIPVICVGNASVGGNGKTPLVIYLVRYYQNEGKRPVVLSRGYKGKFSGPYLIGDKDTANLVGDEPLLIKSLTKAPVVIAKKRVLGVKLIEQQNLGDIIILDDGLQHRALARDSNYLCFDISNKDALNNILNDKILPVGRLREPLRDALKRSDYIFLNKRGMNCDFNLEEFAEKINFDKDKIKFTNLQIRGIFNLETKQELKEKSSVIALSAIANPKGFYETLTNQGILISKTIEFSDHCIFDEKIINQIIFDNTNSIIICTEKDAVKLNDLSFDKTNFYYLAVELMIE